MDLGKLNPKSNDQQLLSLTNKKIDLLIEQTKPRSQEGLECKSTKPS